MAVIFADRIKETTTTTGTGGITLAGAVQGFRTFASAMTAGDTCYYCIDDGLGNWEIGLGTFNTTFERTTVHTSSTGGTAIDFAAGMKTVYLTVSAACWNDWTAGLGSLAALPDNLVFEYEVTGSAVTTITATGLDLNADGGNWEIHFGVVSATDTDSAIRLYINNDTTYTNYISRYIFCGGTSITTDAINDTNITYIYTNANISYAVSNIGIVNNHICYNTHDSRDNASKSALVNCYKSTTDTNITQLDFTCATASGIGVGSKVKIFKKEW